MYNEPYSLSDPPSDQFPFLGRDEDEECKDAAAEPTQGPNRAEHGTERPGSVGKDRGQRDRDAHGTTEVHQGDCEEEV